MYPRKRAVIHQINFHYIACLVLVLHSNRFLYIQDRYRIDRTPWPVEYWRFLRLLRLLLQQLNLYLVQ